MSRFKYAKTRRNPSPEPPKPEGIARGTRAQHMAVAKAADTYRNWCIDQAVEADQKGHVYAANRWQARADAMEDMEAFHLRKAEQAPESMVKAAPRYEAGKPIVIRGRDSYAVIVHPWDSFLTMFGRFAGETFIPARGEKTRNFKSMKAAERAATTYFLRHGAV